MTGRQGNRIQLVLDAEGEHFRTSALEERLTQALSAHLGEPVRLEISLATVKRDWLAARAWLYGQLHGNPA